MKGTGQPKRLPSALKRWKGYREVPMLRSPPSCFWFVNSSKSEQNRYRYIKTIWYHEFVIGINSSQSIGGLSYSCSHNQGSSILCMWPANARRWYISTSSHWQGAHTRRSYLTHLGAYSKSTFSLNVYAVPWWQHSFNQLIYCQHQATI